MLGDRDGSLVGVAIGFALGFVVGFAVGTLVGLVVGFVVGDLLGTWVGKPLGQKLGLWLGEAVGPCVGEAVGAQVIELLLQHVAPHSDANPSKVVQGWPSNSHGNTMPSTKSANVSEQAPASDAHGSMELMQRSVQSSMVLLAKVVSWQHVHGQNRRMLGLVSHCSARDTTSEQPSCVSASVISQHSASLSLLEPQSSRQVSNSV